MKKETEEVLLGASDDSSCCGSPRSETSQRDSGLASDVKEAAWQHLREQRCARGNSQCRSPPWAGPARGGGEEWAEAQAGPAKWSPEPHGGHPGTPGGPKSCKQRRPAWLQVAQGDGKAPGSYICPGGRSCGPRPAKERAPGCCYPGDRGSAKSQDLWVGDAGRRGEEGEVMLLGGGAAWGGTWGRGEGQGCGSVLDTCA